MSKVPDLLAQSYPVWVLCAWTVENVQLSQIRGKKQEKKKTIHSSVHKMSHVWVKRQEKYL